MGLSPKTHTLSSIVYILTFIEHNATGLEVARVTAVPWRLAVCLTLMVPQKRVVFPARRTQLFLFWLLRFGNTWMGEFDVWFETPATHTICPIVHYWTTWTKRVFVDQIYESYVLVYVMSSIHTKHLIGWFHYPNVSSSKLHNYITTVDAHNHNRVDQSRLCTSFISDLNNETFAHFQGREYPPLAIVIP